MSEAVHRERADRLTDEERELFEELAEDYEGEPIGDVFEHLAQSVDSDSEVANS